MAAPLFSKICIHLYCWPGFAMWSFAFAGGRWVGDAAFVRGDLGEMWAVYISVHVSIMGTIWEGERSARVRLCDFEKVMT